jgi:hypothetical protein
VVEKFLSAGEVLAREKAAGCESVMVEFRSGDDRVDEFGR